MKGVGRIYQQTFVDTYSKAAFAMLYLALNDIDHTKTKAQSPQTNGICERCHKTILQEFYQITFRKKLYTDSIIQTPKKRVCVRRVYVLMAPIIFTGKKIMTLPQLTLCSDSLRRTLTS